MQLRSGTLKRSSDTGMPAAHEHSGHLYPQPAHGLAPDSSTVQISVGELVVPTFNFCYKLRQLQWGVFRVPPSASVGLLFSSVETLAGAWG